MTYSNRLFNIVRYGILFLIIFKTYHEELTNCQIRTAIGSIRFILYPFWGFSFMLTKYNRPLKMYIGPPLISVIIFINYAEGCSFYNKEEDTFNNINAVIVLFAFGLTWLMILIALIQIFSQIRVYFQKSRRLIQENQENTQIDLEIEENSQIQQSKEYSNICDSLLSSFRQQSTPEVSYITLIEEVENIDHFQRLEIPHLAELPIDSLLLHDEQFRNSELSELNDQDNSQQNENRIRHIVDFPIDSLLLYEEQLQNNPVEISEQNNQLDHTISFGRWHQYQQNLRQSHDNSELISWNEQLQNTISYEFRPQNNQIRQNENHQLNRNFAHVDLQRLNQSQGLINNRQVRQQDYISLGSGIFEFASSGQYNPPIFQNDFNLNETMPFQQLNETLPPDYQYDDTLPILGANRQFNQPLNLIIIEPVNNNLTSSEINGIKVYKVLKSQINKNYLCSICLCTYEENEVYKVMPGCQHQFHSQCIDIWLQQNQKCPNCRNNIKDALKKQNQGNAESVLNIFQQSFYSVETEEFRPGLQNIEQ